VSFRRGEGRPLVIGHRGAAALAPENTLEAFEAAIDAGADAIEFDVGTGLLLGHSDGERADEPAHLDDALAFMRERGAGVHIDLKRIGIEDEVAAAVRRHGLEERTLVSSTWAGSIRRLGLIAPGLTRAISYPRDRYNVAGVRWPHLVTAGSAGVARAAMPARVPLLLRAARANALSLHHKLVSPAVVRTARGRGAIVLAWTVNDPAQILRVAAAGVDGVVSDDPARALEVLATLNPP